MAAHRHEGRLDAAAPLVLDTRELGRRPGSMRPVHREVPSPRRIGLDLVAVPEGGELVLDLRMESVVEGVLVTGTVSGVAEGECSRCLEPLSDPVSVHLTELYAYPSATTEAAHPDDETRSVQDDLVDLEEAITDAVALALPLQPLCGDDCAGLCSECGERLAVVGPDHRHETMDPRWAALAAKFADPDAPGPQDAVSVASPARSTTQHGGTEHGAAPDVEET
jgi:uncharacterized protein